MTSKDIFSITNKNIIISGGNGGIGSELVKAFISRKAKVISIAGGSSSIRVRELANLNINAGGKIEVYGKPKRVISKYTLGGKVLIHNFETVNTSFPKFLYKMKKIGAKYEIQK